MDNRAALKAPWSADLISRSTDSGLLALTAETSGRTPAPFTSAPRSSSARRTAASPTSAACLSGVVGPLAPCAFVDGSAP